MRIQLLIALLLLLTANALAQTRSVSGAVYAAGEDEPLAGATVKVVGTDITTTTDADGNFRLSGLGPSDKYVEVSFVGMKPGQAPISDYMKIYLDHATELLDEMIVVAFGKQKRESFTGSASVVDAAQIARSQVTNPIQALNGTVTGLNMVETNSFGSDASITIRGLGSLNASNEPLIVLDGMPYNGFWNDLNPADIASMTVLKDAASNALYGARGANGVILITSKSAKKGRTDVTFNAKWGANHDGRIKYDVIEAPGQYYEGFYIAWKNHLVNAQGQTPEQAHVNANSMLGAPYSLGGLEYMLYAVPQGQLLIGTNGKINPNATLGNRVSHNGEIYTLYPDNWLDAGLRDGFRQEYNVTVSSGDDRYTMYASLGYLKDNGIAYNNDIERYTARLKADAQIFPFLKIGGAAAYNHTTTNLESNVFSVLTDMSPIYPLYIRDQYGNIMYDSHGKIYDYGNGAINGLERPICASGNYIQDDLLNLNRNVSNAFNIQGFATLDFLHDFHFTVNGNVYITENRINAGTNPFYGYDANLGGSVETSHYRTVDFNTQQLLNYSKKIGLHSIDALLGHEYTNNGQTSLRASRNKVALWESNKEIAGAINDASMGGYTTGYNVEGWFMRAQYDYDSRYFASASFRRDGSSRFHPKNRWGNFWSVGAAWIMSKEDWFPKTPMVNMLKLKASYGEQGNDNIGNFRYTNTYNITNSNGQIALVFDNKGNQDITWETVGSLNTGAEFELFNSRLNGGVEFYVRNTRDMLMFLTTPLSLGYSGYYDNIGDMRNTGLEVQLSADIITSKAVTWNVGLNLSWERNRLTRLPEQRKLRSADGYQGYISGTLFYGEGLPLRTWYMPKYAGVNDQGVAMFYTKADDGTLGTTTIYEDADYFLCGSALPKVFGGFNTSVRFYGVDISAQFNYSIGGKKYDTVYNTMMTPPWGTLTGLPMHKDIFKAWTPENNTSDIPRWQYDEYQSLNTSDRFLLDASYLSLSNVTVGYTLPKKITDKLYIKSLRIFAQGENLYYWTKRKGFDPRMGTLYGNYNSDSYYSFPMRTISGGISVEF